MAGPAMPHRRGNAQGDRDVFGFETFGNEGFWTDAMRMPQGMKDAKVTSIDALKAGVTVDVEAIEPSLRAALAKERKTDMSPQNAPLLNDPITTVKLIEMNAVVGIVPKDSNGDGSIDLASGDKVGLSCAICHTISDKSVVDIPAGSIGKRLDGRAALALNVASARGREHFRNNCTSCHNVDQSRPVPTMLVDMKKMMPDYQPEVLGQRPL